MEKTFLLEQLNVTKAALEEKSGKVERMQDELKKLNIKIRQQTKSLEEKVSTLATENAQLKTANADNERQLQAVKNLHQSQVSQLEAKLKLESSCKVSSTQPSPSPTNNAPSRLVAAKGIANQAPPPTPQLYQWSTPSAVTKYLFQFLRSRPL